MDKDFIKEHISNLLEINIDNILSIFLFGSRLYGCEHKDSDFDYVVIVKDKTDIPFKKEDEKKNKETFKKKSKKFKIDAQIFTKSEYHKKLKKFQIDAFECFSLSKNEETKKFIICDDSNLKIPVFLNDKELKNEVRKAIGDRSRISFVKAKKKLELEANGYVGIKSFYHSFRILEFGKQVLECGYVKDFTVGKKFYDEIVKSEENIQREYTQEECSKIWKEFQKEHKSVYNKMTNELKKI
eukprot:gene6302-10308_t